MICSNVEKLTELLKITAARIPSLAVRVLIILDLGLLLSTDCAAEDSLTSPQSLTDRYAEQTAVFKEQIEGLARECKADQQLALAERIERFYPKPVSDALFLFRPSDDFLISPATPEAETFRTLRREHGTFLVRLAQEAAAAGNAGLAIPLLYESLYCDGNLAKARQILGQKKLAGKWVSLETAARMNRGEIWSQEYGWLSENALDRYKQGERLYRGKWISEKEDIRRHRQMRNGWKVETDHYEVTTNLSLQAGVKLAQELEAFYNVWSQLFADYYFSSQLLEKQVLQTNDPPVNRKKYKVHYFRNRAEYDLALARIQPGISGKTLGVYIEKIKTAYFFAPAEDNKEEESLSQITIWHEATHQLFAERIATRKVSGLKNNFWIVEGIACFMETLHQEEQGWRLGGPMAGRLAAARIRLERDHFYVPFAEMVTLGAKAMLSNPQYRTLYTQAAGQAAFLMTARHGRFRQTAIEYLRRVYRGQAKLGTLALLTGIPLTTLDRDYREFLFQPRAR